MLARTPRRAVPSTVATLAAVPHPAVPHPAVPHPTVPHPTVPHPTVPHPTVPFAASIAIVVAVGWNVGVAAAAEFPEPVAGDYVIESFEFHTGETIPEMKVHYLTVGEPDGKPVLVLHGTTGSAEGMLGDGFAGELFGPGQPLDAAEHYLIIPDTIGGGGSSKPSDGMKATFPRYDYVDMVAAQHEMLTEHLGVDHLRLVIGNSMGGMLAWTWGIEHPDYMDAIVPMASLPGPMSGRNWMMRRMLIDAVRTDPAWMDGEYTEQPPNLRVASAWFGLATSGGNQALQAAGPTREAADAYVDDKLANQSVGDANDTMYRWDASYDFDPSADLEKITAHVLVVNSADDERNPPELGVLEREMPRIANGEVYIIPGSAETKGHGTTGSQAHLYAEPLREFLASVPEKK